MDQRKQTSLAQFMACAYLMCIILCDNPCVLLIPGFDIKDFRSPALGQAVLKADLPEHQFYLADI